MSNAAANYPDDLTAKKFRKIWQPYGQRHTRAKRVDNLTGALFEQTEWRTYDTPLTDDIIDLSLLEKVWSGYYSSIWSPFFSIDIDDYKKGQQWQKPSAVVVNKYSEAVKRLYHNLPTFVVQSLHGGLHPYWFLTQRLLSKVLQIVGRQQLKELRVEILPTPKHSLRIPSKRRFLDPETLEPINFSQTKMRRYQPYLLFNSDYLSASLREQLASENRVFTDRLRSVRTVEKVEELYTPIMPGYSNVPYCKIVTSHFNADFTEQESFERFMTILWRSGYRGELLNPHRLKQRIKSSYRTLAKEGLFSVWQPKVQNELEITDILFIENLMKVQPFAKQREKHIKHFLEKLCRWVNYHDDVFKDKEEFAWWSYVQQPKYATCRNAGLYPLPSAMMRPWNKRYNEIVDWLCGLGVLEKATGYWYDKDDKHNNFCRYFKVNRGIEENTDRGAELVLELANLGLKQSEIANGIEVSQKTISKWLHGENSISKINWNKIESFLEYTRSGHNTPNNLTGEEQTRLDKLIKELENL